MRTRYKRNKRKSLGEWPVGAPSPEEVARNVQYIGSAEHKSYPSKAGSPALRSDASRCDPRYKDKEEDITEALQEAIRNRAVCSTFQDGFFKYAWGFLDDDLYEVRHINGPVGTYKAYKLEESIDWPEDPENKLGLYV
jgi:hypothetical protein